PEVLDGSLSRHCDQYSLAIVYQELLTGQRPFGGGSLQQMILQHLQATPNLTSLPAADRPAVAPPLSNPPHQRFTSCRDFGQALESGARGVGSGVWKVGHKSHAPGSARSADTFDPGDTTHITSPWDTARIPTTVLLNPDLPSTIPGLQALSLGP